jgi:hypothetical protein
MIDGFVFRVLILINFLDVLFKRAATAKLLAKPFIGLQKLDHPRFWARTEQSSQLVKSAAHHGSLADHGLRITPLFE